MQFQGPGEAKAVSAYKDAIPRGGLKGRICVERNSYKFDACDVIRLRKQTFAGEMITNGKDSSMKSLTETLFHEQWNRTNRDPEALDLNEGFDCQRNERGSAWMSNFFGNEWFGYKPFTVWIE